MSYEKLSVYKFVKGPKGEQGERGDQGDQGKGYTGSASPYNAYMDTKPSGLSLHQVKCGETSGVVWMVSEAALSIGELSYVIMQNFISLQKIRELPKPFLDKAVKKFESHLMDT